MSFKRNLGLLDSMLKTMGSHWKDLSYSAELHLTLAAMGDVEIRMGKETNEGAMRCLKRAMVAASIMVA